MWHELHMLHVVERQIVSQNSGLFRDNPNEAHNLKVAGSNPTPATTLSGSQTTVCEPFLFSGGMSRKASEMAFYANLS